MNIPKFRAWDKVNKKMREVNVIDFNFEKIRIINDNGHCVSIDFKNIELMQSTGLKDKNGKKIFEGDILKGKFYFRGVGIFDSGEGNYKVCDPVVFKNTKFICRGFDLKDVANGSVEVIGNIYENPELLKEGAK